MGQVQRYGDKKCQLLSQNSDGPLKKHFNYDGLNEIVYFGIENAINKCKVQ
jgi:hypothetical protein